MPIYLDKNTNARPVYLVDANGNPISGSGGGGGAASQVTIAGAGNGPVVKSGAPADGPPVPSDAGLTVRNIPHLFTGTNFVLQFGDVAGAFVQGNAASGSADSGNPLKMGGVYNPAGRLVASGQRSDVQMGAYGSLKMQLMVPDGQTPINATSNDTDGTNGANALSTSSFNRVWNGTAWDRQRGDVTGTWVHGPQNTVDTSLSGTITASGGTASIAFVNTARQEVINPSTATIWARWGAAPAVNGAGSFPIAPGGTFSTDRTGGTLQLLSTAANQNYTVNRYT